MIDALGDVNSAVAYSAPLAPIPTFPQRGKGQNQRRAQRWPEWLVGYWLFGCRLPTPVWLRRGAQLQADQGRALFERSEFARTPPEVSTAGCPRSAAQGDADSRVAFLLGTFLWRSKEKYLARRGETRPPP